MAVQSEIFSTEYGVRSFISTKHIATKQHMSVWLQRSSDNIWVQLSTSNYELINNSAVLTSAPNNTIYSQVEIRVADTPDELGSSQSEISIVAGLYDEIVSLNGIKNDITTVAGISGDVTTVSSNILDINSVVTNIVPNLAEILQADTNATTATTKASEASASATSASNSATTATNQATIATTKASEASASATSASNSATTATTKASEASASATSASNSEASASNSATTATNKANEASSSASSALTSANNASTSEDNALLYSNNAKGYADSINPSLLVSSTEYSTHLSVPASYNIYNGQVSLSNTVITNGFSTTLYTGNGTSQSITTDVDMATQWGNDASEKFGGLVWVKNRTDAGDEASSHCLTDTVRGSNKNIFSNLTNVEQTTSRIDSFDSDGFNLNTADTLVNLSGKNYASWNFQTTHRVSGTTNHGKAFTCHYNPFTGFTMVKYEGSGLAGHEIPHYLGRKLEFEMIKCLGTTANWEVHTQGNYLIPNLTDAGVAYTYTITDSVSIQGVNSSTNVSNQQHILYGWASSYFDEKNTLIGNYEIGVYQGTGASGNKITTRGKPAWVMIKRLDSTGNWVIQDNLRGISYELYANLSNAQSAGANVFFNSDGFTIGSTLSATNASGGQYLYMVVYDNDSGSGKSKYPKATDTSTLNLNAHIPFANGIDTTGSKVSIAYKNETVTLSNALVQGKNYIALLNDGSYVATPYEPMYSMRNRSKAGENPDYFDVNAQKWYSTTGGSELVVNGTFDTNTTGWTSGGSDTISWNSTKSMRLTSVDANGLGTAQTISTVAGRKYQLSFNVAFGTRDTVAVDIDNSRLVSYTSISGFKVIQFTANSSSTLLEFSCATASAGLYLDLDNISVIELVPIIGTALTPRNYLDCVVYADQNGQPEYVEQIEKVQYFDAVKANEFKGKNACTAWANVSSSVTLLDNYNFSAVTYRSGSAYKLYFKEPMDNVNYVVVGAQNDPVVDTTTGGGFAVFNKTLTSFEYICPSNTYNTNNHIIVFGGKN